jgi:hypothetical protein
MKSLTCCLAAALCLAGCRAPAPTFKDVSPFGATRIEPPRTNSFGTPDSYYQPPPPGNPGGAGIGSFDSDEQFVTLPRGGERDSDISLVNYEQDVDRDDRDARENRHDRDDYVGQVPEPATLLILDASPLPGEGEASRESSTSRSAAGTTSHSDATSSRSESAAGRTDSPLRFNAMPVHDVTSHGQGDGQGERTPQASSSNDQIELRDIGELPAVPDTVRERMAGEFPDSERTMTRSPGKVVSTSSSSRESSSGDVSGWRVR